MAKKKQIRIYSEPAGGWGALKATGEALALQGVAISGAKTLLRMNQPEGFDCPGCAWPDPKHTSSFEFCENGAKAVAWEATVNRCTPAFFAAHSVSELSAWDEHVPRSNERRVASVDRRRQGSCAARRRSGTPPSRLAYPEANPLVPLYAFDPQSRTPSYKSVPVKISRAAAVGADSSHHAAVLDTARVHHASE